MLAIQLISSSKMVLVFSVCVDFNIQNFTLFKIDTASQWTASWQKPKNSGLTGIKPQNFCNPLENRTNLTHKFTITQRVCVPSNWYLVLKWFWFFWCVLISIFRVSHYSKLTLRAKKLLFDIVAPIRSKWPFVKLWDGNKPDQIQVLNVSQDAQFWWNGFV